MRGLLISWDSSPVIELDIPDADCLGLLQGAVGGDIEALALPPHVDPEARATAYVNEEGKYQTWTDPEGEVHQGLPVNWRATDLLVPGVGLFMGDWVAGNMVLVGFDPETGEHLDLPAEVERALRRITREAGDAA